MEKQPCPIYPWKDHLDFLLLQFGKEYFSEISDDCEHFDGYIIGMIADNSLFISLFNGIKDELSLRDIPLWEDEYFLSIYYSLKLSLYLGIYCVIDAQGSLLKNIEDDDAVAMLSVLEQLTDKFGNRETDYDKETIESLFNDFADDGMEMLSDDDDDTYYIDEEIYWKQFIQTCNAYFRYGVRVGECLQRR